MISVVEALKIIYEKTGLSRCENTDIASAYGKILAENVFSPIHMPPFRQSAMDGFALKLNGSSTYLIKGEVKAGDNSNFSLNQGEAVRIFTGAMVPDDADAIVIREHVEVDGAHVYLNKVPAVEANIRPMGEQVKKGDAVLNKGTKLNEAGIGFLAGLGISEVNVFKTPVVTLLITGNELQEPGSFLQPGCIYESNSVMLQAALRRAGISRVNIVKIKDTLDETTKAIATQLSQADVLLITGGISVGDYDFVKEALEANSVKEAFYKVNQKPGKPLWFGTKDKKLVFALPGNPAASLTCFYVYVLPALQKLSGDPGFGLQRSSAQLTSEITNTTGKSLFLKGKCEHGKISVLTGQASSMLISFAQSNALIYVPETVQEIKVNEEVAYYDLNF